MSDELVPVDDASTPLTLEEREGLLQSYITLRGELNEAEQENIIEAGTWLFGNRRHTLSTEFLNDLHHRMFGNVWKWAGAVRTSGKNIGVDASLISSKLLDLVEDCDTQVKFKSFGPDEIAVRFHHRLVFIHPYPNGNGRHSRLATDWLLISMDQEPFTWGNQNLVESGETRRRYVQALRAADQYDYQPLFDFVRS